MKEVNSYIDKNNLNELVVRLDIVNKKYKLISIIYWKTKIKVVKIVKKMNDSELKKRIKK